jgi:hypothetical protein
LPINDLAFIRRAQRGRCASSGSRSGAFRPSPPQSVTIVLAVGPMRNRASWMGRSSHAAVRLVKASSVPTAHPYASSRVKRHEGTNVAQPWGRSHRRAQSPKGQRCIAFFDWKNAYSSGRAQALRSAILRETPEGLGPTAKKMLHGVAQGGGPNLSATHATRTQPVRNNAGRRWRSRAPSS